jgi:pimeloyl-ACP methyl ester carboxylesterase
MHIVSVRGEGSPVLLLHGSPSSPSAFEPLADALAPKRRVFIGALPGYRGAPPLVPFELETLHAGIEATLLSESAEPWALIGFSMGSFHALSVALRGNVTVRAVAMLGAFPGVPEELRALVRESAEAIRTGALPPEAFPPRMLSEAFLLAHPEARDTTLAWLRETTLDVLADELTAVADAPGLLSELARAKFQLLFRTGELDVATPAVWSEAAAKVASRATLEIVPRAGHALILEDLEGTRDSLLRFLKSSPGP